MTRRSEASGDLEVGRQLIIEILSMGGSVNDQGIDFYGKQHGSVKGMTRFYLGLC